MRPAFAELTVKGLMKLALFLALIGLASMSYAEDNPLLGKWVQDMDLTMASINSSGKPPERVKLCYGKDVCGKLTIEFKEKNYRVSQNSRMKTVSDFWPYKIISTDSHTVITEETNGKKETHIVIWHIENNVACHELDYEGFKYNECFRKNSL